MVLPEIGQICRMRETMRFPISDNRPRPADPCRASAGHNPSRLLVRMRLPKMPSTAFAVPSGLSVP